MDELIPIYRIEFFLDAIVNNTTPPEPIYRAEFYLAKIAGADVEIPEPVYRMEKYLAYLCGEEVELPDPIYRIEYYLAFLCGLNVELPEPIYRVEFWLWDWCGGGGIEKTVTGNPIHITDALAKPVQALSISLEPIQDLHGYDNPWPAGGGKNKFLADFENQTVNGTIYTLQPNGKVTTSGVPSSATDFVVGHVFLPAGTYILNGCPANGGSGKYRLQVTDYPVVNNLGQDNGEGIEFTISTGMEVAVRTQMYTGAPSSLTFAPMIRLSSVADATFAPYSNICPISGHTDADVTRTGKNLLDATSVLPADLSGPAYVSIPLDTKVFAKAQTETITVKLLGALGESKTHFALYIYDTINNNAFNVGGSQYLTLENDFTLTGVVTVGGGVSMDTSKPLTLRVYAQPYTGASVSTVSGIMLYFGSTASDYEEYRGTTYPIPLGQTVYGGTLDVVTGVLTVTHILYDIDGTNRYFSASGSYWNVYPFNELPLIDNSSRLADWKCSISDGAKWNYNSGASFIYTMSTNWTGVFADVNEINAFASTNTIQLLLKLATPQTIQLTPTQVELLQGENNIWSDGEMTLVYLADGNASDVEALNILLGGRYVNNHGEDEPTDREALDILLGRTK